MSTTGISTTGAVPIVLPPVPGDITFEEFLGLVADGEKADLLEGNIHMASPDNTQANRLNVWLVAVLSPYVEFKDLGQLYVSRVAFRLGNLRGPEPDIAFVSKLREALRRRGYIDGPPDLAIEIVSPDSIDRDYVTKRNLYEEAGVLEYWILDPDHHRATFLCLKDGKFVEVAPVSHIYRSAVLGLELDVRWLTSEDRPRAFDLLQKLLA